MGHKVVIEVPPWWHLRARWSRESELPAVLDRVRNSQAQVEHLPVALGSFIDDFQNMDIRWQKAQLQTILGMTRIYRGGRIEVEFRE